MEPSADTPTASLLSAPGRSPRPTAPSAAVQRNASDPRIGRERTPTTTDPSPDTPSASLDVKPRPAIPVSGVHRNASGPLTPTATLPSPDTARPVASADP